MLAYLITHKLQRKHRFPFVDGRSVHQQSTGFIHGDQVLVLIQQREYGGYLHGGYGTRCSGLMMAAFRNTGLARVDLHTT